METVEHNRIQASAVNDTDDEEPMSALDLALQNAQEMRHGGLKYLDRAIVQLQTMLAAREDDRDAVSDADFRELEHALRFARYHLMDTALGREIGVVASTALEAGGAR